MCYKYSMKQIRNIRNKARDLCGHIMDIAGINITRRMIIIKIDVVEDWRGYGWTLWGIIWVQYLSCGGIACLTLPLSVDFHISTLCQYWDVSVDQDYLKIEVCCIPDTCGNFRSLFTVGRSTINTLRFERVPAGQIRWCDISFHYLETYAVPREHALHYRGSRSGVY